MRRPLALTIAAVAVGGFFAAPASATCMPVYDKGDWYVYTCSAPGGPAHTTYCYRPLSRCVTL
jgi:hypothetical protein